MDRYPTRNGISVPSREIWMPKSSLEDIDDNKNWHHREYTARAFGSCVLYFFFRNMESHEDFIPIDVHAWIHRHFDMPYQPTPVQAMEEIERGFWEKENLRFSLSKVRPISAEDVEACKNDYNKF